MELALNAEYGQERAQWPWGLLAAARLLTELRLRVDEQAVFVPLLDRLRDGVPVGRLKTVAVTGEQVVDQLAKSIRVMLNDAEAGEVLSEAADAAYEVAVRHRELREDFRAKLRAPLARPADVDGDEGSDPSPALQARAAAWRPRK